MTHDLARHVLIDRDDPSPALLDEAAAALRRGELVVFPTETVYGLGANALDQDAVRRVFEAKGRPSHNPLIVHVASAAQAQSLARSWPVAADRAVEAFWPGPLTLVLPKRAGLIPDVVTAGRPNVALRLPSHPVARALIERAGVPVCAPSANLYMAISPTRAEHVLCGPLIDRVALVLDAGAAEVGVESTVLSLLDAEAPALLRPGMITIEELSLALRLPIATPEERVHQVAHGGALSPGRGARHYAPRARLKLVDRIDLDALPDRCGVLLCGARALPAQHLERLVVLTLSDEPRAYARQLYDALHRFDERHVETIFAERPRDANDELWRAALDRLQRAATPLTDLEAL